MINKITAGEIYANSVERLSDYPTAASRYGTGGLSASALKGKYDLLAKLAISKINETIDLINADADDIESIAKSIMTQIPTGFIDGEGNPTYRSLHEVIGDIIDGDAAGYFALTGLSENTLQGELEDIETRLYSLETSVGDAEDAKDGGGSVYARIAKNASDIADNAQGIGALDSNKINKSDIINNLITGGSTKVASAETVKTLQASKVNKSDIVDNLTTGGASSVLSAEQGKNLHSRLNIAEGGIVSLESSLGGPSDAASAQGSAYARIKHNYDTATQNTNKIGAEDTSATILYRIKSLEALTNVLDGDLQAAMAILQARQQPIAVDDIEYLSKWLQGVPGYSIMVDGKPFFPEELMTGTVILARAVQEPDYWWDGGITTPGTITVGGTSYVSTAEVNGIVIGGLRELEYNYSEVDAAVQAAEGHADAAAAAQLAAEGAKDASRAWADGTGATSNDPQYENNAKYYAEAAEGAKVAAVTAKSGAESAQDLAETAAANMVIEDVDSGDLYSYSFKLVGGKPQIQYSFITT